MSDGYNGWKNYETWNVALWIDNDQGTYSMRQEWAEEAWADAEESSYSTKLQDATSKLAKMIESFVDENNPLASENSMFSDILSAALSEVDYYEIAENWLDEVDKEEPEEDD